MLSNTISYVLNNAEWIAFWVNVAMCFASIYSGRIASAVYWGGTIGVVWGVILMKKGL